MVTSLSPAEQDSLLHTLQKRFVETAHFHPAVSWDDVKTKLEAVPEKLKVLQMMEATGGEPTVVPDPEHPSAIVFMDCAAESPLGRRSLCYDEEARRSRKSNAPMDSAVHMAAEMGIELLTEAQYRALQALTAFDQKTSSWVLTPESVRKRGGALFCDRRYGQVFLYHNSADSYYQSRGFRAFLML